MNPDPRVFFASERTLLAWLRTGIAIVGLGFVVSRFGLFVHLIAAQSAHPGVAAGYPHLIGVVFVGIGSLSMVAATVQHGRFIRALPKIDRPVAYSRTWALWLAGLVSLASLALAVYLALAPE
jgi:putative membrane protein